MNMTKSTETQIALLEERYKEMNSTLDEIKVDVKEIKGFMTAINESYVTRKEFESFKSSQFIQKLLVGIVTAVMTAIIMYEVMKITK